MRTGYLRHFPRGLADVQVVDDELEVDVVVEVVVLAVVVPPELSPRTSWRAPTTIPSASALIQFSPLYRLKS